MPQSSTVFKLNKFLNLEMAGGIFVSSLFSLFAPGIICNKLIDSLICCCYWKKEISPGLVDSKDIWDQLLPTPLLSIHPSFLFFWQMFEWIMFQFHLLLADQRVNIRLDWQWLALCPSLSTEFP